MLDEALSRLDETTEVTVGTDSKVAGRDAYELILTPRTADTLVGEMRFAVDGENGAAVAASVTALGESEPAFQIAFTQIDFSAPDAAVFAFAPGADVTVGEEGRGDAGHQRTADSRRDGDGCRDSPQSSARAGLLWSSCPGSRSPASRAGSRVSIPSRSRCWRPSPRPWQAAGLWRRRSFSMLITDDGRVLGGAVPVSRLVETAQTGL